MLREVLDWLWAAIAAPVLDEPVRLADTGVLDRVIFSYTPTIRALIHNQPGTGAEPHRPAELLAIAVPRTPGLPPLRNADEEVDAIAGQLPGEPVVLRAGDATVDAVRLALQHHQWLHYVGHSTQYLGNPSQASLFLHDGRLTMLAVSRLRLDQAEIATPEADVTIAGASGACAHPSTINL